MLDICTNEGHGDIECHGQCSLSVGEKIIDGASGNRRWRSSSPATYGMVLIAQFGCTIDNLDKIPTEKPERKHGSFGRRECAT
jgi:hypothetical protein